jgi:hypothetical protein
MKRAGKKANKYERTEQKKKLLEYHQSGTGLYRFKNRSSVASLELPKLSREGKKWVGPNDTWEGDSYFLSMVPKDAIVVESISSPKKEEQKMPEKLILDQPDQITRSGKVEHSVVGEDLPLNETGAGEDNVSAKERLFTEDPMSGITIIRD